MRLCEGSFIFTGHNPKFQKMALFVIPGGNDYISKHSGQNSPKMSGAVDNIGEQDILQFQNYKFNGVEVMQVLAMSRMAFSD